MEVMFYDFFTRNDQLVIIPTDWYEAILISVFLLSSLDEYYLVNTSTLFYSKLDKWILYLLF